MDVSLLIVPYDCGRRGARMGAGPEQLLERGLVAALEQAGHRCEVRFIEADTSRVCSDTTVAIDLLRLLAAEVAAARAAGAFPLTLAGPCYSSVGVVAGTGADRTNVLWFDAHGDFNTPETTSSGFLDGMGAAILTGRCWTTAAATIPGHRPLPEERLLMIGVRDLDPAEEELLDGSRVTVVTPRALARDSSSALGRLIRQPAGLYLHFDPDALDRSEGVGNDLASTGGLRADQVLAIARRVAPRLCALTIASYDPACDIDGRIGEFLERLAITALGGAPGDTGDGGEAGS